MKQNPFPFDPDRSAIWEMLVNRDIQAFCKASWSMVAHDFVEEGFMGIDGGKIPDPDLWRIQFPDLKTYRDEWIRQAMIFQGENHNANVEGAFFELTRLTQIEINGDCALAHKKFDGFLTDSRGEKQHLNWQTLYQCRKIGDQWKISGFIGYLPYPLGIQVKE